MEFSPTARRGYVIDEPQLNLNPMMDMFGVLIPAVLVLSGAIQVAVLTLSPPTEDELRPGEGPSGDIIIGISGDGYAITATGGHGGLGPFPAIPLQEMPVLCARYRGTRPPPRSANRDRESCGEREAGVAKPFRVYDTAALRRTMIGIKGSVGDERQVILAPSSEVEYESVVDVMDAIRDQRAPDGNVHPLFDQVSIAAPTP